MGVELFLTARDHGGLWPVLVARVFVASLAIFLHLLRRSVACLFYRSSHSSIAQKPAHKSPAASRKNMDGESDVAPSSSSGPLLLTRCSVRHKKLAQGLRPA